MSTYRNAIRSVIKLSNLKCSFTVDHLVNATSLGHTFNFEEATDTSVFPHLMVRTSSSASLSLLLLIIYT